MIKKTKRKAFNFLRSYFDVLNELTNDKDKLDFLEAIINKQFLNEDPKELNFIVNLCYESQRHQIETSVKGWLRATNEELNSPPPTDPPTDPMTDPQTNPPTDPKEEEEEDKEEVEEEVVHTIKPVSEKELVTNFCNWFNSKLEQYNGRKGKFKTMTPLDIKNLKKIKSNYSIQEIEHAFCMMLKATWVIDNNKATIDHFVRNDNFVKYLNIEDTNKPKFKPAWA